jgi:hypothetical protein
MPQTSENGAVPPIQSAVPLAEMRGDDELDDKLLHEMADKAIRYIRECPWCIDIHEQFFGDGYGGIVALFLLRVTIRGLKNPEWIWVIVGDMPSAYLEAEGFKSPQAALRRYIDGIEDWIATPENERGSRKDLPPIDVPPADEFIEMLRVRMETLRAQILPHLQSS